MHESCLLESTDKYLADVLDSIHSLLHISQNNFSGMNHKHHHVLMWAILAYSLHFYAPSMNMLFASFYKLNTKQIQKSSSIQEMQHLAWLVKLFSGVTSCILDELNMTLLTPFLVIVHSHNKISSLERLKHALTCCDYDLQM